MKVLYLTPWYPSEKDAMAGLFVQKHVEAVRAQGVDVRVIDSTSWLGIWHQWSSLRREGWLPDVVQLNVIQKQGLLALWLKWQYGIPYIIVEHWSGYLPENLSIKPYLPQTWIMQFICRKAEVVMPVSLQLQNAMTNLGFQAKLWQKTENVVDDSFFDRPKLSSKKANIKTLLHVSCFDEQAKNVKGLLHAAKILSNKHQDWQLVLVGTGVDYSEVRAYADSLDFPEGLLKWTGELTPQQVADLLHQSDVFILSSRYETYGVVLAEAAAAGVPILSTPVGIAEEIADLIVPQEIAQHDPQRFAEFIETILRSPQKRTNTPHLRNRFSAAAIGKQLKNIYKQCTVSE